MALRLFRESTARRQHAFVTAITGVPEPPRMGDPVDARYAALQYLDSFIESTSPADNDVWAYLDAARDPDIAMNLGLRHELARIATWQRTGVPVADVAYIFQADDTTHRFAHVEPWVTWVVQTHGLQPGAMTDTKTWAFQAVASAGNLPLVRLLAPAVDMHAYGERALLLAAEHGHLHVVRFLSSGSHNHARDTEALQSAAMNGHLHVVQYLVTPPHAANTHDMQEYALRLAARNGHVHVVQFLVARPGTDVHALHDLALLWAAQHRQLAVVHWLIDKSGAYASAAEAIALGGPLVRMALDT